MSARAILKPSRAERAGAAVAVVAVMGGVGWLLSTALGVHVPPAVQNALASFDVAPPPPPPPERPPPPRVAAHAPRHAAAPPARRANPTPVVAPPPIVAPPVPPLVVAAPMPGTGAAASVGAAAQGSGTGAGGEGSGRGGGGTGGGGTDIRLVRDKKPGDLPPAARHLNGVRTVFMRWVVGTDGRVHDCRVTRSSGDPELDAQTCALLTDRLRYAPARDRYGRKVSVEVDDARQRWDVRHDPGADGDREGSDRGDDREAD